MGYCLEAENFPLHPNTFLLWPTHSLSGGMDGWTIMGMITCAGGGGGGGQFVLSAASDVLNFILTPHCTSELVVCLLLCHEMPRKSTSSVCTFPRSVQSAELNQDKDKISIQYLPRIKTPSSLPSLGRDSPSETTGSEVQNILYFQNIFTQNSLPHLSADSQPPVHSESLPVQSLTYL